MKVKVINDKLSIFLRVGDIHGVHKVIPCDGGLCWLYRPDKLSMTNPLCRRQLYDVILATNGITRYCSTRFTSLNNNYGLED